MSERWTASVIVHVTDTRDNSMNVYRLEYWCERSGSWLAAGYWRTREAAEAYAAPRDFYFRIIDLPVSG